MRRSVHRAAGLAAVALAVWGARPFALAVEAPAKTTPTLAGMDYVVDVKERGGEWGIATHVFSFGGDGQFTVSGISAGTYTETLRGRKIIWNAVDPKWPQGADPDSQYPYYFKGTASKDLKRIRGRMWWDNPDNKVVLKLRGRRLQ